MSRERRDNNDGDEEEEKRMAMQKYDRTCFALSLFFSLSLSLSSVQAIEKKKNVHPCCHYYYMRNFPPS